jgi:hypothetical protein
MMHRTFGFVLTTFVLAIATARPVAAQMVSSAAERAKYDTTGNLPDSLSPSADADRIAGRYSPTLTVDEFDKSRSTIYEIGDYILGHGSRHLDTKCTPTWGQIQSLRLAKFEKPSGATTFVMFVQVHSFDWLMVGDERLQMLADSVELELPTAGTAADRSTFSTNPITIMETQSYHADTASLRRLAGARGIKARINGSKGSCTFAWKPQTIARFRQFVAHELPPR